MIKFKHPDIENIKAALRLRNVVLCGVLFFLIFKSLLGFSSALVLLPAYILLTVAFLLNFFAYLLLKNNRLLYYFSNFQFVLDLLLIILAIYFSGGIENTWGFLLSVVIVISGLYFSLATALTMAFLSIIAFAGMVWLEYLELIPHFGAYGTDTWKNLPYMIDYISAMVVLYLGAAAISVSAGYNFKKRKEEAEAYAQELKNKIKTIENFNQELRDKYADIEKMNELFVGRELEMVHLKEEITRLKGKKA